jgi:hypothetical protein
MLAVCITTDEVRCTKFKHDGKSAPPNGSVLRIRAVQKLNPDCGSECDCLYLVLDGGDFGVSERFRPAVQDDQACEEDFRTLLKRCKPAKAPVLTPNRHERVGYINSQSASARTLHSSAGAGEAVSHTRLPTHSGRKSSDHALGGHSQSDCFPVHEGHQ